MSNSEGKEALVTMACSPEPVAKNKAKPDSRPDVNVGDRVVAPDEFAGPIGTPVSVADGW